MGLNVLMHIDKKVSEKSVKVLSSAQRLLQ